MFERYGSNRVTEPGSVLSTSAWKVDNSREIGPNEVRVSIKRLHIETTSFKQICLEGNNNPQGIRQRILDIVVRRGKLHNPVTDTGGVLYGVVEEIGADYPNNKGLKAGDEIICNASLAAIPIYIDRLGEIDMAFHQVEAEGYAILFQDFPIVRVERDVPVDLLLYFLDESGTPYEVAQAARGKERFLVVGNNLLTNLIFGFAIRKTAGKSAKVVCLFDHKTDLMFQGRGLDNLMKEVFTEVRYMNILKPLECVEELGADEAFDMSVNCADIPGAETVNILAAKFGGIVFFANLINNYNIALYITECISRQLDIRCATGYREPYDQFDIQMVREIAPFLTDIEKAEGRFDVELPVTPARANRGLEQPEFRQTMVEDFVCESRPMTALLDEVLSVAKYDCNVLITGEEGAGKTRAAGIIQKNSSRKMQPFVKVSCASIAKDQMEGELFGFEEGAAGVAAPGKRGYFDSADNGILFLDEVSELSPDIQAKLLRVIQDGEFYRIGGSRPVKANVRILSATRCNMEELIDEKKFRRDLYYALNVFPIRVPSLRERRGEIPALTAHFSNRYNEKFGTNHSFEPEAMELLQNKSWKGNVRELETTVERLLIGSEGSVVSAFDVARELNPEMFSGAIGFRDDNLLEKAENLSLEQLTADFEKGIMRYAYEKYGSSRKAARALGISQTQFVRKKNKYGIETPENQ